jgi:hypothetical protein
MCFKDPQQSSIFPEVLPQTIQGLSFSDAIFFHLRRLNYRYIEGLCGNITSFRKYRYIWDKLRFTNCNRSKDINITEAHFHPSKSDHN